LPRRPPSSRCLVAALGEQKRRRRTAASALAINNILLPRSSEAEQVAYLVERNIDGARQLVGVVFGGKAHIEPEYRTGRDPRSASSRNAVHQGLLQQSTKSCLASRSSTPSVFMVTLALRTGIRHQRLLAEGVAALQFGQLDAGARHLARHLQRPLSIT
jgi:hypothetical protein